MRKRKRRKLMRNRALPKMKIFLKKMKKMAKRRRRPDWRSQVKRKRERKTGKKAKAKTTAKAKAKTKTKAKTKKRMVLQSRAVRKRRKLIPRVLETSTNL